MIKAVFSGYFCQKSKKVYSVSYPFFTETQSGDNQAIRWKDAFNSSDTQIQTYPAISPGGDNIIYSQIDKRFTIFETFHQVAVYIGS